MCSDLSNKALHRKDSTASPNSATIWEPSIKFVSLILNQNNG